MLRLIQRNDPSVRLCTGTWWVRLLMAVLFTLHVNYVPLHLATATHQDIPVQADPHSAHHPHPHPHEHTGSTPTDNSHHSHPPHSASDHTLNFTAQSQTLDGDVQCDFISTESSLELLKFGIHWSHAIIEDLDPPEESPPDPGQPRAPPVS